MRASSKPSRQRAAARAGLSAAESAAPPGFTRKPTATKVGELVKNAEMTKTYLRLLNKLYRQMELAIQGE
jgi:hypothetical protein